MKNLSKKDVLFIGPGLGIPRAGSLSFEMAVAPYLPENFSLKLALFIYTLIFFAIAYWLSMSPGKLVDRMGKILIPTLLFLILVIVIGSFIKPLGGYGVAVNGYEVSSFFKGFIDGYYIKCYLSNFNNVNCTFNV